MGDSSGRPYYLVALIIALLLLATGAVTIVQAFSGAVSPRRAELPAETASRAPASSSQPARDTHAIRELLDQLDAAYRETEDRVRQGDGDAAVTTFETRWQECHVRLDTLLPTEQAAGRLRPEDLQAVYAALEAYRQAAQRLHDYARSGLPSWLDEATTQATRARQQRDTLNH